MRIKKLFIGFTLLLMLIPAMSVSAASNAYTSGVTSNSLWLNWTLVSGEGFVKIYQNGVYLSTVAGTGYNVTGLAPCTNYTFNVYSGNGGSGSTQASATTLGCDPAPTAPVISYTISGANVNVTWTSSNATSYDIYKDNVFVANTTDSYYNFFSGPSQSYTIKIIAKNNSGITAISTQSISLPAFSNSWTSTLAAGNIKVGSSFSNTSSTTSTTMYINLYSVTSSGDVFIGSNAVNIPAGQTVGGYYNLAYSQPAGTYKVVLTSTYATTSGVSLLSY